MRRSSSSSTATSFWEDLESIVLDSFLLIKISDFSGKMMKAPLENKEAASGGESDVEGLVWWDVCRTSDGFGHLSFHTFCNLPCLALKPSHCHGGSVLEPHSTFASKTFWFLGSEIFGSWIHGLWIFGVWG